MRKNMAKPPESDEFVRDVIAAHLPKGEELLWAGRPGRSHLRALCRMGAIVVAWAVAMMEAGALGVPPEAAALVVGSVCAVLVLGVIGVLAGPSLRHGTYLGLTGLRVVQVAGAVKPGVMRSFDLATMAPRRVRRSLVGRLLPGRAFTWAVMEGVRDPGQVAELVAGAHWRAAGGHRPAEPADGPAPACDPRAEAALAPRLREGEGLLWADRDRRSHVWRRVASALAGLLMALTAVASGHAALESPPLLAVLVLYAGFAVLAAGASTFAVARAVGRRRRVYGLTPERILSALVPSGGRFVSVPLAGVRDLVTVEDTDGAGSISFGLAGRGLGLRRHHLKGLAEVGSAYESFRRTRKGAPTQWEAGEPTP
jgi:hypothetical protein